jgi:hypothetical protein
MMIRMRSLKIVLVLGIFLLSALGAYGQDRMGHRRHGHKAMKHYKMKWHRHHRHPAPGLLGPPVKQPPVTYHGSSLLKSKVRRNPKSASLH